MKEKLKDILQQVQLMKMELDHLKQTKALEAERQQDFILNCSKIMSLMKERQKEFVLDQIIQLDEQVRGITTDIAAFKNIRAQLFQIENTTPAQKLDYSKYMLIFFHIFESVINNTSLLVDRYSHHLISQCPKEVAKTLNKVHPTSAGSSTSERKQKA